MRLAILGGGGFRVPLVYRALLDDHAEGRVTHVTLHDLDAGRLGAIARVLAEQADGVPDAPEVEVTTDLDEALVKADFVFVAIRVLGLDGRAIDERRGRPGAGDGRCRRHLLRPADGAGGEPDRAPDRRDRA
jgi:6-phospho-beta-glucosidase